MNDSTPRAGITAQEILDIAEQWSISDRELRTTALVLRDDLTGKSYIHYSGASNAIAKAVVDLMRADESLAHSIFAAVTLTAHKSFLVDEIEFINAVAQRISVMRHNGATDDEIKHEILKLSQNND